MLSEVKQTLPIQLRAYPPSNTLLIAPAEQLVNKISSRMEFDVVNMLKTCVSSVPHGEVDIIFPDACIAANMRTDQLSTIMSGLAQTINMYGTRSNQRELDEIVNILTTVSPSGKDEKDDPVAKAVKSLQRRYSMAQDATASFQREKVDMTDHMARSLFYSGCGKIANLTEPGAIYDFMKRVLSMMNSENEPVADPQKIKARVATLLFLLATEQYDTGIFKEVSPIAVNAYFPGKSKSLYEFAHLFQGVAYSRDMLNLVMLLEEMAVMKEILKPTPYWTPSTELKYGDLIERVAAIDQRNPYLFGSYFTDALKSIKAANNVNYWVQPATLDLIKDIRGLTNCMRLPVAPGEYSRFLPLAIERRMESALYESLVLQFANYMTEAKKVAMVIAARITALQINESIMPRIPVKLTVAQEPSYFTPRFATVRDTTPSVIGLSKRDINDNRVLAPYINGIMSYRHLHDQLVAQNKWSAQVLPRDLISALGISPSLCTLPLPSHYLLGENYHQIVLTDDAVTAHIRKVADLPHVRYLAPSI